MIFAIKRPGILESDPSALDTELRAARRTHHLLLDFEDKHQALLDEVAETVAPGIGRIARIVNKLISRKHRMERSTGWSPPLHDNWRLVLKDRLQSLRNQRNSDPRWKTALKWADMPG